MRAATSGGTSSTTVMMRSTGAVSPRRNGRLGGLRVLSIDRLQRIRDARTARIALYVDIFVTDLTITRATARSALTGATSL
ncbi:MAG: hypothetical protein AB7I38_18655 [Dehalococcoidia bacterium]